MFRMEYVIKGTFDEPVVEKAVRAQSSAPLESGELARPYFQ